MTLAGATEAVKAPARIVDAHLHAASTRFLPRRFLEGVADNTHERLLAEGRTVSRSTLYKMYESTLQDHECDGLVRELDQAQIAQAILLLPDFTFALGDDGRSIFEMYDLHHAIRERHPGRFEVFATPDPRWGGSGLELFVKGIERYGFRGAKLYPAAGYSLADDALTPFFEVCADYALPVVVHVGGTSPALDLARTSPLQVEPVARRFREVTFILAHAASAYTEECVMLAKYRPNVYLDVSAYAREQLPSLVRILTAGIDHKVIFGTDWPVSRLNGPLSAQLEVLLSDLGDSRLAELELARFFHGTIDRLLAATKLKPGAV